MAKVNVMLLDRMKSGAPGAVFSPRMFDDLARRAAVDQALSRLTKAGKIRRIARGLYDIPKTHPLLGVLSPDPEAIARSIATQAGYRLQPTPAHAANALGLSTQVPAKIVYLIDGSLPSAIRPSISNTLAHGLCWERALPQASCYRRFAHSDQITSPRASFRS
jgi:hypothetical protein